MSGEEEADVAKAKKAWADLRRRPEPAINAQMAAGLPARAQRIGTIQNPPATTISFPSLATPQAAPFLGVGIAENPVQVLKYCKLELRY